MELQQSTGFTVQASPLQQISHLASDYRRTPVRLASIASDLAEGERFLLLARIVSAYSP